MTVGLCVVFFFYLQGYGFLVSRLFDLLFEVRDQYNETLLKKWSLVFRSAVVIFTCDPLHNLCRLVSQRLTWIMRLKLICTLRFKLIHSDFIVVSSVVIFMQTICRRRQTAASS